MSAPSQCPWPKFSGSLWEPWPSLRAVQYLCPLVLWSVSLDCLLPHPPLPHRQQVLLALLLSRFGTPSLLRPPCWSCGSHLAPTPCPAQQPGASFQMQIRPRHLWPKIPQIFASAACKLSPWTPSAGLVMKGTSGLERCQPDRTSAGN